MMTGCHCLDLGVNYPNKVQCRHTPRRTDGGAGGGGGAGGRGVSRTMGRAAVVTSGSQVWPVMTGYTLYIHCNLPDQDMVSQTLLRKEQRAENIIFYGNWMTTFKLSITISENHVFWSAFEKVKHDKMLNVVVYIYQEKPCPYV